MSHTAASTARGLLNQRNRIYKVSSHIRLAKWTKADVRCVASTEEDGHWISRHVTGTDRPFAGIQLASREAECPSSSAGKFTKLRGAHILAVGSPLLPHMVR